MAISIKMEKDENKINLNDQKLINIRLPMTSTGQQTSGVHDDLCLHHDNRA